MTRQSKHKHRVLRLMLSVRVAAEIGRNMT